MARGLIEGKDAREYAKKVKFSERSKKFDKFILDNINLKSPKICDLCCGSGNTIELLKNKSKEIIGIDASEEMIKIYEGVKKGALDPPFLSFDNYLDSVKGKKSPYKFDTEEQIKARKQRKQDAVDSAAAEKQAGEDLNKQILNAVKTGAPGSTLGG